MANSSRGINWGAIFSAVSWSKSLPITVLGSCNILECDSKVFFRPNLLFIGPESDHWLCLSVTPSLADSCLINLMPVNDASCLMMSQQLQSSEKFVYVGKKLFKLSTNDKRRKTLASWQINYVSKGWQGNLPKQKFLCVDKILIPPNPRHKM